MSYNPNFIKNSDIIENNKCESLAKELISTTKLKLPTLLNSFDLEAELHAVRQKKAAREEETKRNTCSSFKTWKYGRNFKNRRDGSILKSGTAKAVLAEHSPLFNSTIFGTREGKTFRRCEIPMKIGADKIALLEFKRI
ncbi:hypothetical protein AVEN_57834-1 [Araneus ventricosus]|uniref:Uncharacterized protein n=1 Tax=Araneus ventricosus TaxID=182803 RepID=A0A4Y2I8N3_ARAVE|nr:hypothetical protein AVEN_57834-1 [Araneus ventricosus]